MFPFTSGVTYRWIVYLRLRHLRLSLVDIRFNMLNSELDLGEEAQGTYCMYLFARLPKREVPPGFDWAEDRDKKLYNIRYHWTSTMHPIHYLFRCLW